MRAVIQRVSKASVKCSSGHYDEIGSGILVFLGIEESDGDEDIKWLSGKISRLRIFPDEKGVMNLGLSELGGEILLISQFTLHASTRKGNRPSFTRAAPQQISEPLYFEFIRQLEKDCEIKVNTGVFGDHMDVSLINDGPVTLLFDTKVKE